MTRLFLLHALGADERMFSGLGDLRLETVFPLLPTPGKSEQVPAYAGRLALELGISGEDIVGGCSFGGLVASEIARQKRIRGLILISSGLSSECIFPQARRVGRLSALLPSALMRSALESDRVFEQVFGPDIPPLYELAREMLKATPDAMLARGGRLCLDYFPQNEVLCPVYAIHGTDDQAMQAGDGFQIVTGAGHGMVLTHAPRITEFLREVVDSIEREGLRGA